MEEMRMIKKSLSQMYEFKNKDISKYLHNLKEEENNFTLEEVIKFVKEGEITLDGRFFEFEERSFFDGKLYLPIMKSFFEEKDIEEEVKNNMKEELEGQHAIILINEIDMVVFTLSHYIQNTSCIDIDTYKNNMKEELKKTDFYSELIEDGGFYTNDLKVNYIVFKIHTTIGYTYNYNFFVNNKSTKDVFICNLSCLDKDRNIYENIIKAIGSQVFVRF